MMKTIHRLFSMRLILLIPILASCVSQQKKPVDYADPLMGTSESRWMLNPGASLPFGMVQLSPDNQSQFWKAGYEYTIGSIFAPAGCHRRVFRKRRGCSLWPTRCLQVGIHTDETYLVRSAGKNHDETDSTVVKRQGSWFACGRYGCT